MSQWRDRKFKTRSNRQHGSKVILSAVFLFFCFFINITVYRGNYWTHSWENDAFSWVNLPLPRRSSRTCRLPANKRAFVFIHVVYYYHVTLFNVTLTIFPSCILPRSRAILLSRDREWRQRRYLRYKLSHTCLRLSFLYFYGWKVDVPPWKEIYFIVRYCLMHTVEIAVLRSHRNCDRSWSYCDKNTMAFMR